MTTQGGDVVHSKSRLTIMPRHQLIDLNKEYINFEIFFECKSIDASKDFDMLIINQDQLNTVDLSSIVMKKTKGGYISGNIVADENKYQNYFLVVRSDNPVEADLEISIRPIPPKTTDNAPVSSVENIVLPSSVIPVSSGLWTTCYSTVTNYPFIILIGIIILAGLLYFGYQKYKHYLSSKADHLLDDDEKSILSVPTESSATSRSSKGSQILKKIIEKAKQNDR